jgi:hypothetical protein
MEELCLSLNVHYVHGVNKVRQTEMHTGEPLAAEPSCIQVETATEKLKRYKSPGIDHIPAKLIQSGGSMLHSEIHKLISSILKRKNCH